MKTALLTSALCLAVLALPLTVHAQGRSLKDCEKDPMASACIDSIGKVLEDIADGKKPAVELPAMPSLDKLPIDDLKKFIEPKK
jgi:hypothetical protein